ncbi:tRNA threonylcarbamoyladenosine biosynthesis protein TsaE [Spiroplasma litorale]|uniref:tRNA threonylcarbamoyladenosine biosynthesis protein TsaE n=1 Tax=Spiroplasma litorale TaxID=216942 RepID=A0A0K1W2I6_9MOLU|nr:tRNA (adenosine(37)-N6)-threonylcarbamoyltransferase complex ATPase subunit type 1 TsaE [Spiroplasma litorale]AKX34545.1 tRNA threonylcarbamoyladenosine biosynthesis protein TsaE [Spiroplasma litorale]
MVDKNNKETIKFIVNIQELSKVVEYLKVFSKKNTIFLLYGSLGAGKTTFTKKLLNNLGVNEIVNSPTFTIMNQYKTNDLLINHIDAYRLKNSNEYEMFLEQMIDAFSVVEWPENLKINYSSYFKIIKIFISFEENDKRLFVIEKED